MSSLKSSDIHWVVNAYIGVSEGFLGDFTYRSHKEFYPAFCDLEIDPEAFPGTTRERFIKVLTSLPPIGQAAVLRGVSKKYPLGSAVQRTPRTFQELIGLADRCVSGTLVAHPSTRITSELLQQLLRDASTLLDTQGPTSAVDRIHTALHAYLKAACDERELPLPDDCGVTQLFKLLRQNHPNLSKGAHEATMTRILQALSTVIDSLNPARNRGSLAHANEELLGREEAVLVINSARTIFQYLDAKLTPAGKGSNEIRLSDVSQ